jgi:import inner membrane translocase subunit TIM50
MRRVIFTSFVILLAIAAEKVEDVRDVLDYYQQFSNPVEAFRENQRKLLVMGSVK